jgi:hypothetical protein
MKDKKELDAVDTTVVRNCKNISLPFDKDLPQFVAKPRAGAFPNRADKNGKMVDHKFVDMTEPNKMDGTLNTVAEGSTISGAYTIDLKPKSSCYFTATNNMEDIEVEGVSK